MIRRITNSMMTNSYLNNMQYNLNNMSLIQNQLASGKEILRTSQDPFIATRNKQLSNQLSENEQFNANIKDTSNWCDTTDTALSQAGNVLARMKDLMIKAGNGAYSEDEIATIKDEVVEKSKELSQIMNTTFDGAYIFGGTKALSRPVTVDDDGNLSYANVNGNAMPCQEDGTAIVNGGKTATGMSVESDEATITWSDGGTPPTITTDAVALKNASGVDRSIGDIKTDLDALGSGLFNSYVNMKNISEPLETEISDGVIVQYNKTAKDIFEFEVKNSSGSTKVNVMDEISSLISNLTTLSDKTATDASKTTASDYINGSGLTNMDLIIENLLSNRAQIGTMQNRMESAMETNEDQNYNMTDILSSSEDIDFTEKTMEYAVMQTVYTASLQTSSKVLLNTIMDYI